MRKLLPFLFVFTFVITNVFSQTCVTPTGGTIDGPSAGCSDLVKTYIISGVTNATDYNWVITGATASKISPTQYNVVFESSDVTITVTPINGTCTGTPLVKNITVSSTPAKPNINQTGNVLNTASGATYQWYRSPGALIIGATSQSYTPTANGIYIVEVKNVGGCGSFSDQFNFVLTSIKEDSRFDGLTFYPNPVISSVHIKFLKKYNVEFYDISGKKAFQKLNLEGEQEIDLTSLKRGIYIMRVNSEGKYASRKLILQ